MKSFSVFSFAVLFVAAGCSSSTTTDGTTQSVNGTSPTGTTPDGFCAKKCIAEDRDRCVAFAGQFSDAFLAAFEACGDSPACLQPKLDAAAKTERQDKLAADYCAKCAGGISSADPATCEGGFYEKDGPGQAVLSFSDARLDGVDEKCLPDLKPGLACELSFRTCVLPLISEGVDTTLECRRRR